MSIDRAFGKPGVFYQQVELVLVAEHRVGVLHPGAQVFMRVARHLLRGVKEIRDAQFRAFVGLTAHRRGIIR